MDDLSWRGKLRELDDRAEHWLISSNKGVLVGLRIAAVVFVLGGLLDALVGLH